MKSFKLKLFIANTNYKTIFFLFFIHPIDFF